jgi:guanosine-3',5'-bis(diphosphate) 3'-pyrophosphohydrolase
MAVHLAGCCRPLPDDCIVGIVTTGKGGTIHTTDCDTLESSSDATERWIDVAWNNIADGEAANMWAADRSDAR